MGESEKRTEKSGQRITGKMDILRWSCISAVVICVWQVEFACTKAINDEKLINPFKKFWSHDELENRVIMLEDAFSRLNSFVTNLEKDNYQVGEKDDTKNAQRSRFQ